MPEPTRAQSSACESLALRHDQVRCTPLADGSLRADCFDRAPGPTLRRGAGLQHEAGYIVKPDGTREPVRW